MFHATLLVLSFLLSAGNLYAAGSSESTGAGATGSTAAGSTPNSSTPNSGPPNSATGKAILPPAIEIKCVEVLDRRSSGGLQAQEYRGEQRDIEASALQQCQGSKTSRTLIGSGDLQVVVEEDAYKGIVAYEAVKGAKPSLFVNGVDLKSDAVLVATERFGNTVSLRFNIRPGDDSRLLWSTLYRSGRTTEAHPLRVGLGWSGAPASDSASRFPDQIQSRHAIAITDTWSFGIAITLIVLLVLLGVFLGYATDIFRDGKTPEALALAKVAGRRIRNNPNDRVERQAALALIDPAYASDAANDAAASSLARRALAGADITAMDLRQLSIGLALEGAMPRWYKATFSFSRLQLGVWFLFAVAAGVFLWAVYGKLPAIDNSLLALLGLSVGVTGLSLAVDIGNPNVQYRPSQGLFNDVMTDWQSQHQIHRFQAVIANLLLLALGLSHVLQHLTYPIFEQSWLAFLGLSGVAFAAGKKLTETK